MRSRRAHGQLRFLGPLGLATLSALALCLPVMASNGSGRHVTHIPAASSAGNATGATTLAANVTGGLPAGGIVSDVDIDNGLDDILAIDSSGNLWLYPNTGTGDANMFGGGRSQVGIGWNGYTLAAVGPVGTAANTPGGTGIVAIDPAGNLWYYPKTSGTGLGMFGARSQIGIGWSGYTVAGIANLNMAPDPGVVATDPAGNLWYYPATGMTGMSTFGSRILVGTGWTGYTADVTNVSPPGLNTTVVVAVDGNGNLWLYPNTGGSGTSTFGARTQVGSGWSGFQAVDLGGTAGDAADIFAIDASGNLWFYPNANNGSSGWATWGAPIQVGTGWTGYRIN
jgi:hypothetical protein